MEFLWNLKGNIKTVYQNLLSLMQKIDMRASFFLSFIIILIISCGRNPLKEKKHQNVVLTDSFYGAVIADTIIYDVIIHNTNLDDQWSQQCLQYMKQNVLIDSLFKLVYEGKIIAYDYFEKKPLRIKDLKKREEEPGFKRENIGKIQFTERWYFDTSRKRFQKEVISIVLGYDLLDEVGKLRGYKPVFKLYL